MLRVDPEKLEAQIAEMVSTLEPRSKGTGVEAVVMRMQLALLPPFMRWKLAEMNGGATTDNEICNAFVAFAASQIAGIVHDCASTSGSIERAGDQHFAIANSIMQGIGEELAAIFASESPVTATAIQAEHVN